MSERVRETDLLRYLTGEMEPSEARDLTRRLAADTELAHRYASLRRTWDMLDLPPDAAPEPALARDVLRRAREESSARLRWDAAPAWARAAAGLALPLGIVLGVALSPAATVSGSGSGEAEIVSALAEMETSEGLAAAYYELMAVASDDDGEGSS